MEYTAIFIVSVWVSFCILQYTFSNYSQDVLCTLPEHIQELFPALLTHRSGATRELISLLDHVILENVSLRAFAYEIVGASQWRRYYEEMMQYYSKLITFTGKHQVCYNMEWFEAFCLFFVMSFVMYFCYPLLEIAVKIVRGL